MIGKSRLILLNVSIVAVLNIILNLILVPRYGINGAAFATMICCIILNLTLMLEARHFLNIIPLRRKVFRITLAAIIPTILLLYVRQFILINLLSIILIGISFSLIYLILIFATRCLDENDLMIAKSLKSKFIKNAPQPGQIE